RDLEHLLELLRDIVVHGVVEALEKPRAEGIAIEGEVLIALYDAGSVLVGILVSHRSFSQAGPLPSDNGTLFACRTESSKSSRPTGSSGASPSCRHPGRSSAGGSRAAPRTT